MRGSTRRITRVRIDPERPTLLRILVMAVVVGLVDRGNTICSDGIATRHEEDVQELLYALRFAAVLKDAGLQTPPDPVAFERCVRLDNEHWLACARHEIARKP